MSDPNNPPTVADCRRNFAVQIGYLRNLADALDRAADDASASPCRGCGCGVAKCGEYQRRGAVACCPDCDHS